MLPVSPGKLSGGLTEVVETKREEPDNLSGRQEASEKIACLTRNVKTPVRSGYPTQIRQGGANLSKGQQQRLALAQALLALGNDRKVVVLDEFTSQLDSETEGRIRRNLRPWLRRRTAVIIAHRLSTST
jgi:ABC-type bacteriocin/lantibiotic exporter with double-glycine peptidase domain